MRADEPEALSQAGVVDVRLRAGVVHEAEALSRHQHGGRGHGGGVACRGAFVTKRARTPGGWQSCVTARVETDLTKERLTPWSDFDFAMCREAVSPSQYPF